MTDLSARLRDVLSDELLNTAATVQRELACADPHYEVQREVLMAALLPFLSSLLEERDVDHALATLERIESRLASSSSPAAPQEQK